MSTERVLLPDGSPHPVLWNLYFADRDGEYRIPNVFSYGQPRGFDVARADGQPDTGGNPPAAVITPAGARPAEALNANPPTPTAVGQGSPAPAPKPQSPNASAPAGVGTPANPARPAMAPAGDPVPSQLGENPAEGEESDPSSAPAAVPGPGGKPLTIGTGAQQATIPGASTESVAQTAPESWEATLSNGQKVKFTTNPDGSKTLDLPSGNWQGLPVLAATVGASLVGIATAPALKPVPKGTPAPLGTVLQPKTRVASAPQNTTEGPPQPPKQYAQTTNPCGCNTPLLNALGDLDGKLGALTSVTGEAASLAAVMQKLNQMQEFAERAWKATHVDKVINLLTLISVLHNASMLSREILETLGYVADNALQIAGLQLKDSEGQPLGVGEAVGTSVQNLIKSIVGEDVYNNSREAYLKANRIVQTASSIIWTVRNIQDTTTELIEWTAEHTGKIGNALKKFGVVGERAYPWLPERVTSQDRWRRKLDRVFNGLEQAEDAASSFAMATSNVIELQEEFEQLGSQREQFNQALAEAVPKSRDENEPVQDAAETAAENSQAPAITIAQSQKG
ncbi:MAG: hypothetical protein ICV77_09775 [Cyanobacteria bacterium Co-bin8]|nr:hypothetical protein [Cyanobacteria bacterium Co-bin8]